MLNTLGWPSGPRRQLGELVCFGMRGFESLRREHISLLMGIFSLCNFANLRFANLEGMAIPQEGDTSPSSGENPTPSAIWFTRITPNIQNLMVLHRHLIFIYNLLKIIRSWAGGLVGYDAALTRQRSGVQISPGPPNTVKYQKAENNLRFISSRSLESLSL